MVWERRTYPHRTPPPETLSARLAPLSRALRVSRSILPRISLSPPQPPKRPIGCGQGSALTPFVQLRTQLHFATIGRVVHSGARRMRPSEDTRERTVARLRRGYVAGRRGPAPFSRRVDRALGSAHSDELHGLTADLPAPRRRWRDLLPHARR